MRFSGCAGAIWTWRPVGWRFAARGSSSITVQVAPSSYYAAKRRQPSARAVGDAVLAPKVLQVWTDNYQVYGARKVWRQLHREGVRVGRDRVARLMRGLGIAGAVRGKTRRTTIADPAAVRAPDLVNRQFTATRPNQLWVSDFTYVASWSGTVYVAFVIDVHSRLVVGWRAAASMGTELVLDALEMAVWRRARVLEGLICHSGCRQPTYLDPLHRTPRRDRRRAVGRHGRRQLRQQPGRVHHRAVQDRVDPPPRPLAHPRGGRAGHSRYIDWYNHRRLHGHGNLPPAELEATYYRQLGPARRGLNPTARVSTEARAVQRQRSSNRQGRCGRRRRLLMSGCGSAGTPRRCRAGARPAVRAGAGPGWGGRACRRPPRRARRTGGTRPPARR